MIPDAVVIAAVADAQTVVDAGLSRIGENSLATETIYRDAYLSLVANLYSAIGREGTR